MADQYPPDYTSDVGKVRLLIPDTETDDGTALGAYVFSDAQISGFLGITGEHVLRAGALAMNTLANDTAMLLKHIRTYDLSVNGPAVAEALRKGAELLLLRASEEDIAEQEEGAFEIVEFEDEPPHWPEGAVIPSYGRRAVSW